MGLLAFLTERPVKCQLSVVNVCQDAKLTFQKRTSRWKLKLSFGGLERNGRKGYLSTMWQPVMFHLAELLSISLVGGLMQNAVGSGQPCKKLSDIKLSTSPQINTLYKDDSHHWNIMQPDRQCQGFHHVRRSQTSHLTMSQQDGRQNWRTKWRRQNWWTKWKFLKK